MVQSSLTALIRPALPDDLGTIKQLVDANRASFGFVLQAVLADGIASGRMYVAEQANTLVGFVHFRHRRDGWTTVYEICTAVEARRQGIGTNLITVLMQEDRLRDRCGVQLKCPSGATANEFYAAVGMRRISEVPGRKQSLIVWQWGTGDA